MNTTSQKTLTLKSMGIDIPHGGGEFIGKTVALISGVVSGYFEKPNQYGISYALTGDFSAVNALTGEAFEGVVAYMPDDYAKTICNQYDKHSQDSSFVEFECEIIVSESEKAARGYTFITRPISSPEIVNYRAERVNKLQSKLKALPAPVKKEEDKKSK